MYIIIRNVCAILLLVPFCYCNQSTNNSYSESKLDTMRREIPLYSDGKERWGYLFKNKVLEQINGDFLENGFDSIQIRIWSVLENIDSVKLLVLKNIDHEWSADLYRAYYSCETIKDSLILKQVKSESKTPKSGWNAFIKELFMLEITSLSDYSKVKGYEAVTKGDTFFVEIASKSEYKFSEHPAPFLLKDSVMEADRMYSILNLVQFELGY